MSRNTLKFENYLILLTTLLISIFDMLSFKDKPTAAFNNQLPPKTNNVKPIIMYKILMDYFFAKIGFLGLFLTTTNQLHYLTSEMKISTNKKSKHHFY